MVWRVLWTRILQLSCQCGPAEPRLVRVEEGVVTPGSSQ
jgi:hypothetical protein